MSKYFAKAGSEVTADHMFVEEKKFEEGKYARCGTRFYKVVRVTKEGVPVFRFFGSVKQHQMSRTYSFKHATLPKGRYSRDAEGTVTQKNYVPCKRGPWWAGATTSKY